MLSLFPHLFQYELLAPFLIRIILGVIFLHWAFREMKNSSAGSVKKLIAILEGVAGILLIIGLWTQGAALFVSLDLLVRTFERAQKKAFLTDGVNYYLVLLVMAVSLLVLGAGVWAFDIYL